MTCPRCDGHGWFWVRVTDPAGVVRVAEASCPHCHAGEVAA